MVQIPDIGKSRERKERRFERDRSDREIYLLRPETLFYFFYSPPRYPLARFGTFEHIRGPDASLASLEASSSVTSCTRVWPGARA